MTLSRLKKRKENLSLYVHVVHQTLYEEVSRCSHAVDIKEMHSCRPLLYFFLSVCSSIFTVKKF